MTFKENIDRGSRRLLYGWTLFAVSSLVFAGIFALLVALARTPFLQGLFSGKDYVRVALVGHVNMAFVVWFLAFEGALWVYASTSLLTAPVLYVGLGWAGLFLSVLGTIFIVVASVFALGEPLFVNYVPIITHPLFYAGLGMLAAGMLTTLFNSLLTAWKAKEAPVEGLRLVSLGVAISGVAVFFSLLCFGLSYYFQALENPEFLDLERLFWGGGHVLQFANTAAMVSVWLYTTNLLFKTSPVRESFGKILLILFLVTILPSPLIYFLYGSGDLSQTEAFTRLMEWGLGPSTVIFGIAIAFVVLRKRGALKRTGGLWGRPEFSSLLMSMGLFALGGVISLGISGYNTKIPAHYHGVIGGVTMAFMGMTYHLIGVLGKEVFSRRIARLQPYVYGLGQSFFAIGMFWAGTLGVERKTFGEAQGLDDPMKVLAMVVFGLGGLLAIVGGILFVVNAGASLLRPASREARCALEAEPEEVF